MADPTPSSFNENLFPTSRFDDTYAVFPARAVSTGHAIAEALQSTAAAYYARPLSFLTVGYIGVAAFSRSQRANDLERHPELMRKARVSAAVDSLGTTWLECITFPTLLVGIMHSASASLWSGSSPLSRAALACTALPLIMPLSSHGADMLMDWAFRPAITYMATPSVKALEPSEWVAPPAEDLLKGNSDVALLGVLDLDPLDRARMEWALDGEARSAFPEAIDVQVTAPAGKAGLATAFAKGAGAHPLPSAVSAEDTYVAAVADIRRRAADRKLAMEKGQGARTIK